MNTSYEDFPEQWKTLSKEIIKLFGWCVWRKFFAKNNTAKIIAAIPYTAGMIDPDRVAFSSLVGLYVGSKTPKIAGYRKSDSSSLERRLLALPIFSESFIDEHTDRKVVEVGRNAVLFRLIKDYQQDIDGDVRKGKINPIVDDSLDFADHTNRIITHMEGNVDTTSKLSTVVSSVGGNLYRVGGSVSIGNW